jgi:two-component system, NtrC family, response regulator AtoC
MRSPAILVADDDPEVLNYLETALLCHKYPVIAAHDGSEALSLLEENKHLVSTVVLDVMMPCKDGIETLLEIRRLYPALPVVMLSGASDPERIVEAMKSGAQEYLTKPVDHEKLLAAVRRTMASHPPRLEQHSAAVAPAAEAERYVQVNSRMLAISEALRKTASWNVPVVLRGESGVGKEVLARELHLLSPRASKEFVKINCVALPSELLESELFGYERGAFTGAFRAKPGKFELADGGTILLDEIGDMDLKLQAKLLQVLQDGEVHRLGGKEPVRVDVRVLVATHRDLERSIAEGNFREDLYYRLNVVSIEVPPLRERKDEILPLAEHFLEKHCQSDIAPPALTEDLKMAFLQHDWPGNVRELENVVRRYLVFEDAPSLTRQLLAASSARTGFRSFDDRFPADSAPMERNRVDAHPMPMEPNRLHARPPAAPMVDGAAAGFPQTGSSVAPAFQGQPRQSVGLPEAQQAVPAPAPTPAPPHEADDMGNGTYAAAATVGATSPPLRDAADPPVETRVPDAVPVMGFEATASTPSSRIDPRSLPETQMASALSDGSPQNPADGWMSRLARLESLLGCLVLGVSEKQPALLDVAPTAEPEAAPSENGRQFVTLDQLDEERNRAEMEAILAALEKTEWNRKKAAKLLKTDYKALLYRMKKLGVGERNDQA